MTEISPAYTLTEHVHDTLFGKNELVSRYTRKVNGVTARTGSSSSTTSERLTAFGEIDDREIIQTLARDKHGIFYLTSVFTEYGGGVVRARIHPDSPVEELDTIMESVFMHKLAAIALNAASEERL